MSPDEFRSVGHSLVDAVADFLGRLPNAPTASPLLPDAMRARLRDPDAFFERVDAIYRSPDWEGEDEVEIVWPESRVLRRYTAPVPDAEGRSVGRIWTFLDITETRRLQTQLSRTASDSRPRSRAWWTRRGCSN